MTFASKVTVTRIAMAPVFAVLALAYGYTVRIGQPEESIRWWALGVFIISAASDGLDGWIARKFNQISELGAYLDPLADKTLLMTGALVLAVTDWGEGGWRLPAWFAALVYLRDLTIIIGLNHLKKQKCSIRFHPHWTGKACTVAQMFALGWVMLKWVHLSPAWPCAVAAVFTIWSGVNYVRQGLAMMRGVM
jgi:CDP-diacylglycerol--glycerol-3-phosphate 3-phosphatidyltransferase